MGLPERAKGLLQIPKVTRLASMQVAVPGSKSITNRALLLAALARGASTLSGALSSEDTEVMIHALAAMGAEIGRRRGNVFCIEGTAGRLHAPERAISVGASGTALRFLTAVATLADGPITITGAPRLRERPMAELVIALRRLGVDARALGERGRPPILVPGLGFPGGRVRLSGRVSSQFVSALLMVGPYGKADLRLGLRREPVSAPYIGLSVDLMRSFGADVQMTGERTYLVRACAGYEGRQIAIEGDASSASYFLALAAMLGETITIPNLDPASLQGDIAILALLERMGAAVSTGPEGVTLRGGPLRGIDADMVNVPDLVPTLAIASLWAEGRTIIRNVASLRHKESDRIHALAVELASVGALVEERADGLSIAPGRVSEGASATIRTYDDHRIAMSFAVLGAVRGGITIEDPRSVLKSYPTFWGDLAKVTGVELAVSLSRESSR